MEMDRRKRTTGRGSSLVGKRLSEEYHFLFYSSCPGTDDNADDADDGDDGDDDNDDDDDDDEDGGSGGGDNRDFKIRRLRTTTTVKHATAHDQNNVTVRFCCVVLRLR